jgi:pilus assembly protein CpaB
MNVKKFLPLIAACGLGLIALIIAHSGLGRGGDKKPDNTVHVIVAKENVAPGQELTADNLVEQTLDSASVPPTAYTQMSEVLGRVTVAPMVAGQPVLDAFLAPKGGLPGLPALVPPGMRAVTIDVNETTGVAGMIVPGSHVDLVSVLNQGEHDKMCARTVASNVPVVAVGQRLSSNRPEGDTSMARTVTLIAKPREAELIALACTGANTRLVLRGNGDVGPADARGVQFTELFGTPMTSKAEAPLSVADAHPVSPSTPPTTQQAAESHLAMTSALPLPSHTRKVTLIQGSTVTTVSFDMPENGSDQADPDDYGTNNTDFVIPNQK